MVTSPNNIISRTKLFAILAIMLVIASHQTLEAKRLNAFMSYTTFSSPETGPFIETYLVVAGNSAEFLLNENNKYQASIQVIILFKAGDGSAPDHFSDLSSGGNFILHVSNIELDD